MGKQHARGLPGHVLGPIEIPGHEETGSTLEINLVDRILATIDASVDDGIERRPGRHRPKSLRDENLAADALGPLFPLLFGCRQGERKITIEIFERLEP